jgi:hypothetical protein
METQGKNPKRRPAAEWASLVEAWTKSGLSAAEFGAKRGIEGARLKWWKWRPERSAPRKRHRQPVKLVKFDVVADDPPGGGWELRTASGDTLRVMESLTLDELEVLLHRLGVSGQRR